MGSASRDIDIVVVGGSYAGIAALKRLAQLLPAQAYPQVKVTLIDKSSHFFHTVGFARAAVDPAYASKSFMAFEQLKALHEPSSDRPSRFRFIQRTLASVDDTHHLTLSDGTTLRFDYLILATGSRMRAPIRAERLGEIESFTNAIGNASRVLVVGGGPVGVEIAGEIACAYSDKAVTLVHRGARLLPRNFKPGLSASVAAKLEAAGVSVVVNERIDVPEAAEACYSSTHGELTGSSGRVYESDLQVFATGMLFDTEFVRPLEKMLDEGLRDANGSVRVLRTMQVASHRAPNVFAPGDVNDCPYTAKHSFKAAKQAAVAAGNIARMVERDVGGQAGDLQLESWTDVADVLVVPIGRDRGAAQMFGIALADTWGVSDFVVRILKGNDYFLSKVSKYFSKP